MKAHTTISLLIITSILCFMSEISHGQEIKVIRRNIEVPQEDEDDQQSSDYNQFAVTIDPIRILSGEFPVTMMYAPVDWLALEAGSGITTENYVADLFEDGSFADNEEFISQKNNLNLSYMLELKLFPDGYVYDDTYYISLRYQYRKYSKDLTFGSGDGPYTLNPYTIYKDLAFIYGYQFATEIDNLFLEYYLGPSLRFIEENEASYEFNSPLGQDIYATQYAERNSLGFLMGVKIGYAF